MRTSRFSALLASTVAVLALVATGCRKTPTPDPVTCELAQPGERCTANGDCCSGSCWKPTGATAGMCLSMPCGNVGAGCGAASDCCNASCDPAVHECAAEACTLGQPGASCAYPTDCCSGSCEGAIGTKVCTSFPACHPAGEACTGTTAADKAGSCCTGYCNGSNVCDQPAGRSCLYLEDACSDDLQCCSKLCKAGKCTDPLCTNESESCNSDAQCCGLVCPNAGSPGATCSSGICLQLDMPCSTTNNQCCSGTCVGSRCVAPPPSGTCATLREACAYPGDCCSQNCQGASGGLTNGTCMPVASCNAPGDICYRGEDCCSGLCAVNPGEAGRCEDASGGCGQDGYPCSADSNCCTRMCLDLGGGAKACQPSGGCRMNGDYCDTTASCCNINSGSSQDITCDPVTHVCENGGACNPPGDICGYKASQNCCHEGGGSGSAVCKPDSNGIMRCFGGTVSPPCPTGWDGNDPDCCKPIGDICNFRDQCCGLAPCTMAPDGVLRCTAQCLPSGATCSSAAAPPAGSPPATDPCCTGATCQYVGEIGWVCATGTPPPGCQPQPGGTCGAGNPCCVGTCLGGTCASCLPNTNTCDTNAQCCSGNCENGTCRTPCVRETGSCTFAEDCCAGLACEIPAGATQGTCTSGTGGCASTGQSCTTLGCCSPTDTCTNGVCTGPDQCRETAQLCTVGGGECCQGLQCYMSDTFEQRSPCDGSSTCFCDVPACASLSAPCSALVPCCNALCTGAGGLTCTSTDPAQCTCTQAP